MAIADRDLQLSEKGLPILSPGEKVIALEREMYPGSEDAEGHIWDILNYVLNDKVPDDWVVKMREKFGDPTPIAAG